MTIMSVVDRSFDRPLEVEENASKPLAGGVANMGYQCGLLWGAALAAGAQSYHFYGPGPQAESEAILVTQRLVEAFRTRTKSINCLEITGMDMQKGTGSLKFLLKGGPIYCLFLAAGYTRETYNEIYSAFSGGTSSAEHIEAPSPPVSCATVLAKRVGVSEMHAVMAAGFAGGIGLSGGGCGALGAAIWITAMGRPAGIDGFSYAGTWVNDTIERFLESSGNEYECADIIGRKFENIGAHAEYLRSGGCSEIIEALAAHITEAEKPEPDQVSKPGIGEYP